MNRQKTVNEIVFGNSDELNTHAFLAVRRYSNTGKDVLMWG